MNPIQMLAFYRQMRPDVLPENVGIDNKMREKVWFFEPDVELIFSHNKYPYVAKTFFEYR